MNRCAAVRKKGAKDQCSASALKGVSFCGRHARSREVVRWASLHQASPIVRVQALVRGWLLRKRLALAGPGVLRRKDVNNEEDLFTCESKDRQHPMQYFSFEEGGKVWWFDAGSLWGWMSRSVEPVNPYTKTPIPSEARRRFRAIQRRSRFSSGAETAEEMNSQRWNLIVQVFRDNGFLDVHPQQFANFTVSDYRTMFVFLERDLQIVLPERDMYRAQLIRICRRGQKANGILFPINLLLRMLMLPRDPYVLVFSILSAFYRC
jgi:hypothetical protein